MRAKAKARGFQAGRSLAGMFGDHSRITLSQRPVNAPSLSAQCFVSSVSLLANAPLQILTVQCKSPVTGRVLAEIPSYSTTWINRNPEIILAFISRP